MSDLLLGLVIIGVCWIGIAELCRRKLTWAKEHPGATYGLTFALVFLACVLIGNSGPEEKGQAPGELGEDPTLEQMIDHMDARRESLTEEAGTASQ